MPRLTRLIYLSRLRMLFSKNKNLKNFSSGNNITLIKGGGEYFTVLENLIDEAKKSIHLHSYIFTADNIGTKIIDALKKSAKSGVVVFVLVDTIGSFDLSSKVVEDMRKSGIHFRFFLPLLSREGFHFGRRLHQKVIVIDSKKTMVGGINIADRYLGNKQKKAWFDFAVLVEGDIAREINNICASIWEKKFTKKHWHQKNKKKYQLIKTSKPLIKNSLVRVRENDWTRHRLDISKSYKYVFKNAENYITIIGAYFLPSRTLRKLIKKASGRGVKINVILSQESDEKVFKLAMNHLYGWFIRYNIKIYEYKPSVVHAKAAVSDNIWTTIGSHDLNFLSTYGLVEMNVEVLNKEFALNFKKELDEIIKKDCVRISVQSIRKKWMTERIVEWFAYHVMRVSFWILTFLTVKEE